MNLNHQKVLVAGLGRTGISVLQYCRHCGIDAAAYDAVIQPEQAERLAQQFPDYPQFSGSLKEALRQRSVLVLSPGISRRLPEIVEFEQQGGRVTGDVAILADILRSCPDKIIAITGSNGKTTTTSLVGHLCSQSGLDTVVAGNIGTPVLQAWLEREGRPADVWVLELSSFQLETTPLLSADASACLNVSEDHLDRYSDLLDYAHAKSAVFNGCRVQVLNEDDVLCRAMRRPDCQTLAFSLEGRQDYWLDKDSGCLKNGDDALLAGKDIPLQGSHNAANALAALALCEAVGLQRADLLRHLQTFQGLPHRVEKVGEKNGVVFIDDSKGTNVGATAAALAGLPEKIVLIAGGQGKGQDFSPLKPLLAEKVRALFLIGSDAPKLAGDIEGCGVVPVFCDSLPEAVRKSYAAAKSGDIVLLSPACASLDMFQNYAHRAQVFIQAFQEL